MADLFPDSQTSFKAKLQSAVQRLAASNIFIGTSSWKYPGWCGLIYDEQRYCYRGKIASPSAIRTVREKGRRGVFQRIYEKAI